MSLKYELKVDENIRRMFKLRRRFHKVLACVYQLKDPNAVCIV